MKKITRRDFFKVGGLGLACVSFSCSAAVRRSGNRPNIVYFLVDDQRNDTLGCAGHPIIKTPVVDSLAAAGVRFTNAFVTTSICAAGRASVFTGLVERTHRFTFGTPPIRDDHVATSYPVLLRKAGYRTGFIGKFGVKAGKTGRQVMFDYFKPIGRSPYFHKQPDGTLRHETELAADSAIEFIRTQPKDQPFCLSVSFNAVHAEDTDKENHYPWPKAVDGMYEGMEMPRPRLDDPAIFESLPDFLKNSMNRHRYFWRWDTPEKYQKNMAAYFRMISGVDHAIGRVRRALQQYRFDRNTIIIYNADNGYYMGDRGFAGKWSHFEQSLRVPLIVYDPRAPGSRRGRLAEQMALNIDIAPTLLDYAGLDIPAHYQGASLVPIMRGRMPRHWRQDFFCEHLMNHKDIPKWEGVRAQRYVYARYFEQQPVFEFLHDLQVDPDQIKNFAGEPEYAEILAAMRKRCDQLKAMYEKARDRRVAPPPEPGNSRAKKT